MYKDQIITVFNPTDSIAKVRTYTYVRQTETRYYMAVIVLPGKSEEMYYIPETQFDMTVQGLTSDDLPVPKFPIDDPSRKDNHKQLRLILNGYNEVNGYIDTGIVVPKTLHALTSLLPEGGIPQLYKIDYTLIRVDDQTRILFDNQVTLGPSVGIKGVLSRKDVISFHYLSEEE